MNSLVQTGSSTDTTLFSFPLTAGAPWRRHLRKVTDLLGPSANDIPFYELAALRFPQILTQRRQRGSDSLP